MNTAIPREGVRLLSIMCVDWWRARLDRVLGAPLGVRGFDLGCPCGDPNCRGGCS